MSGGGPAFPCAPYDHTRAGADLRDYFAAKAMQAGIACGEYKVPTDGESRRKLAIFSYAMADAMLKERNCE